MTIDPFWTSAAAIWGAGLSTLVVVLSIVPSRPRFHVEPRSQRGDDLTVRIVNPAKRMRFVRQLCCWPFPGSEKTLPIHTDESPGWLARRWIALKSESETTVYMTWVIGEPRPSNRWLVIFGWRGAWIVPWIWVPVPVYVSTGRAKRLNDAQ